MVGSTRPAARAGVLALALVLAGAPAVRAQGTDVFVSPVRAELRGATRSETITVTNRGNNRVRLAVKVMEWTQDAQGQDVYTDSGDIVYFPRQLDVEPDGKRQIRIGANHPAGAVERTYRMFIEEQPEPKSEAGRSQIAVYVRFGVPVFLPPEQPRPQPEISEPTLQAGKLSLQVKNAGNQHLRVLRLKVDDGEGFAREASGWYTLAGAQRTYTLDLPREVCRKGRTLGIAIEGEGFRADRQLHVDPARCAGS